METEIVVLRLFLDGLSHQEKAAVFREYQEHCQKNAAKESESSQKDDKKALYQGFLSLASAQVDDPLSVIKARRREVEATAALLAAFAWKLGKDVTWQGRYQNFAGTQSSVSQNAIHTIQEMMLQYSQKSTTLLVPVLFEQLVKTHPNLCKTPVFSKQQPLLKALLVAAAVVWTVSVMCPPVQKLWLIGIGVAALLAAGTFFYLHRKRNIVAAKKLWTEEAKWVHARTTLCDGITVQVDKQFAEGLMIQLPLSRPISPFVCMGAPGFAPRPSTFADGDRNDAMVLYG